MPTPRAETGLLRRFLADERGATAIEYAMVASGVAVAVAAAINALGAGVSVNFYDRVAAALK